MNYQNMIEQQCKYLLPDSHTTTQSPIFIKPLKFKSVTQKRLVTYINNSILVNQRKEWAGSLSHQQSKIMMHINANLKIKRENSFPIKLIARKTEGVRKKSIHSQEKNPSHNKINNQIITIKEIIKKRQRINVQNFANNTHQIRFQEGQPKQSKMIDCKFNSTHIMAKNKKLVDRFEQEKRRESVPFEIKKSSHFLESNLLNPQELKREKTLKNRENPHNLSCKTNKIKYITPNVSLKKIERMPNLDDLNLKMIPRQLDINKIIIPKKNRHFELIKKIRIRDQSLKMQNRLQSKCKQEKQIKIKKYAYIIKYKTDNSIEKQKSQFIHNKRNWQEFLKAEINPWETFSESKQFQH